MVALESIRFPGDDICTLQFSVDGEAPDFLEVHIEREDGETMDSVIARGHRELQEILEEIVEELKASHSSQND